MKNLLKKNQIIILLISLILITVGYINYSNNPVIETTSPSIDTNYTSSIGDATLVSSNVIEENEINLQTDTCIANSKDEYFENSKLERDTMYSQIIDSYQKMLENINVTSEQKAIATQEITKINNIKNSIMITENLIKTKGFEDSIIFENNGSISVIIKTDVLTQDEIAQIQNIVSREMQAEMSNIHISNR